MSEAALATTGQPPGICVSLLTSPAFLHAGDTTGNLMWRLQHGESPSGSGAKVMVLLIGANDLVIAAREVRRLHAGTLSWRSGRKESV